MFQTITDVLDYNWCSGLSLSLLMFWTITDVLDILQTTLLHSLKDVSTVVEEIINGTLKLEENLLQVEVFYEELNYESIEESAAYTVSDTFIVIDWLINWLLDYLFEMWLNTHIWNHKDKKKILCFFSCQYEVRSRLSTSANLISI